MDGGRATGSARSLGAGSPPVTCTSVASVDGNTKEVILLNLADLRLDPENPRLPPSIDGTDELAVLEWMIRDVGLMEIIGSIGAQGYFAGEPLLVTPGPNGAFIVVEGNRRLAATKLLADPTIAPARTHAIAAAVQEAAHHPLVLPAIVYDARDEILDYLGYRHVTGVKEWDSLAKARYVAQLVRRAREKGEELSNAALAKRIGSRADYVARLRASLEVFEHARSKEFYGLEGVDEDSINFSVLTTALSYEKINRFIRPEDDTVPVSAAVPSADATTEAVAEPDEDDGEINDSNLKDLLDWTFRNVGTGTVVGESRNLTQLAAVVDSKPAREALKSGSTLTDASLLTDEPLVAFRRAVAQARSRLEIARGLTHRISTRPDESDIATLTDLRSLVTELRAVIEAKLRTDDDDD